MTTYSKHIYLPLSQHSLVQVRNIRQKYKSYISSRKKNQLKSLYLLHKNISILYTGIRECVCIIFARCSRGSNIGWTVGVRHQYNAGLTPQLSVNCVLSRPTPIIISWISPGQIPTNSDQVCPQRFSLEGVRNGHNLVLSSVTPSDAGVYTCHISAFHRTELHHTIQVRSLTWYTS